MPRPWNEKREQQHEHIKEGPLEDEQGRAREGAEAVSAPVARPAVQQRRAEGGPAEPREYGADSTLLEVLADLAAAGFDGEFWVDVDGALRCRSCGLVQGSGVEEIQGLRRIEGASDPADMAAVVAVTCPACRRRGAAVVRFGPEASAGDAAFLLAVDNGQTTSIPAAEQPRQSAL
ncbi:MAG: hypothetical protein WD691_09065 [Acidimicrobiales bacterium]